jgi:hypothetical protein
VRLPGWTGLIHNHPADVVANGTTMVVVFVGWLTALIIRQSLLFLREQTLDKVDNKFFVSTKVLHVL